ncbi:MAG: diacylglycerol O-acyltransferase / wax synthase [Actinomycetota bacterium]|nr:diacylglycerol O-acyltransferase / wax synthase [Actinomycetota bacterium]
MKQLTGLDNQFLAMETHAVTGHVGSVCVLDPSTATEKFTLEHITKAIEGRLPLVPLLRRRLVEVPFGLDQSYWIDDPDFDIEFHVRELALPKPGNNRQLSEQVARLHARPLDRSRPLWELYLISGLEGGKIAIYNKIHHAAVDGVSGGDVLSELLDLTPQGRLTPQEVQPFVGEQPPGAWRLLGRSAVSALTKPMDAARVLGGLIRSSPAIAGTLRGPLAQLLPGRGDHGDDPVLPGPSLRAPRTPFNANITPHRRWAFTDLPLSEIKTVRQADDLTVNDVVMALCAGALRRWLRDHDALPSAPLVAAVPVSIRGDAEQGSMGNQISFMLASLPTHLESPAERLPAVHSAMGVAKAQHGAIPAKLLADVSEFAMPVLANQAWRLSARLRLFQRVNPYNVIISNVPGPDVPLYLAGAELQAYYPVSAIFDGQGLNITVMSYRGTMFFGLVACRELVPDLDVLAEYLRAELDEMLAVVANRPVALSG